VEEKWLRSPGALAPAPADNGLMLVRYRELARLSPCKGLDDCPGVGYGVSEILSRT